MWCVCVTTAAHQDKGAEHGGRSSSADMDIKDVTVDFKENRLAGLASSLATMGWRMECWQGLSRWGQQCPGQEQW